MRSLRSFVCAGAATFLIAPLVELSLSHPGDQVPAIDIERPVQGLEFRLVIARSTMGGREIAQQSPGLRIRRDRPFEGFRRGLEIA